MAARQRATRAPRLVFSIALRYHMMPVATVKPIRPRSEFEVWADEATRLWPLLGPDDVAELEF